MVVDVANFHDLGDRATGRLRLGLPRMGAAVPEVPSATPRLQASAAGRPASFDHHSWGWGGDFVWLAVLIGLVWACSALWWR